MFRRIIPSKKLFFYMINRKKVFAVGAGLAPARHTSTYVRLLWGIGTYWETRMTRIRGADVRGFLFNPG